MTHIKILAFGCLAMTFASSCFAAAISAHSDVADAIKPASSAAMKLVVFRKQPVQFSLGATYYLSLAPEGPQGWGARATVTLSFPE